MAEVDRALSAACSRAPKDPEYCEGTPVKDTCNLAPSMRQVAERTSPLLAGQE